jgi:hypothetical protein
MVSKFVLALAAIAAIAPSLAFAGGSSVSPDGSLFVIVTPYPNPYVTPQAPILGTGQPVGVPLLLPAIQKARESAARVPIEQKLMPN